MSETNTEITLKGNAGNFGYTIVASPSEEVKAALVKAGFLRTIQANPTNAWEKEIAFPGKDGKRPEGFKRSSIPFTKENADLLFKKISDAKIKIEVPGEKDGETVDKEFDLGIMDVEVTEYTGAEGAVPKYRDAKKFVELYLSLNEGKLKSGEARTVASFCATRGLTEPDLTPVKDEESGELVTPNWADDVEFLASVKAWQDAEAMKALMAQE